MMKTKLPYKNLSVMIVDDSPMARCVVRTCLKELGVSIFEFRDGLPALEFLSARAGQVDLIILDNVMKQMNGDELCRKIRYDLKLKDLPVLFLSGSTDKKAITNLFKSGASDYLNKPFIPAEFIARIKVHLQRILLTKELKSNVHELKHLNKMKDELMAICSHDLRNPLNGVLGYAQLLLREEDIQGPNRKKVQEIQKSGNRLLALISSLLDSASAKSVSERLQFDLLDMNEVLQDAIDSLHSNAIRKGIIIDLCLEGPKPFNCSGDKSALSRILTNILSNGIKFSEKNSIIKISLIDLSQDLQIIFEDQGIGIPSSQMTSLFEKYTPASREGTDGEKSTGLGLSISKELISAMSGHIHVFSEEGVGTTFTVTLPTSLKRPNAN